MSFIISNFSIRFIVNGPQIIVVNSIGNKYVPSFHRDASYGTVLIAARWDQGNAVASIMQSIVN